jgi:hypothetical protein
VLEPAVGDSRNQDQHQQDQDHAVPGKSGLQ